MTTTDARTCACCGKTGPVSADETDPGADELALDSLGLRDRHQYVCGACLDDLPRTRDASQRRLKTHDGAARRLCAATAAA